MIRAKRNQSEEQKNQKQTPPLSAGYTLYNQTGQKFFLPNVKMSGEASDQELERQILFQQNRVNGGQMALLSKGKDDNSILKSIGTGTTKQQVTQVKKSQLQLKNKVQTSQLQKRPPTAMQQQSAILSQAPIYRIAHPYQTNIDMNARLWQQSTSTTKGLLKMSQQPKLFPKQKIIICKSDAKKSSLADLAGTQLSVEGVGTYQNFEIPVSIASRTAIMQESHKNFYDSKDRIPSQATELINQQLSWTTKPYSFLSSVGGKMMALKIDREELEETKKVNKIEVVRRPRPQTVSTISRINFNSMILDYKEKEMKSRQGQSPQEAVIQKDLIQKMSTIKMERPLTTKITKKPSLKATGNAMRIKSANVEFYKSNQEHVDQELGIIDDNQPDNQFYNQTEQSVKFTIRAKSSWFQSRPLSELSASPEQFFQTYTKYTNFSALDLPYEELFDRNERTIAATFAKFGDLGYYSPIQRIGCYMQFSAKLKQEHLNEIVDLQQTMTSVEKGESEIPIQLAVVDDLNPFQSKNKTGINSGTEDPEQKREPVTLSLFPEYFEDEDESLTTMDMATKKFGLMVFEMGGNYDPALLGKSNYIYIDPAVWPESVRRRVEVSLTRYHHYIHSEQIKQTEIPKYKKEWMVNAFNLISEDLIANEQCSRLVFQEIFETFKISMKRAMLDYILRSPEERRRLHIELLPREWLCSSQRISREGGFNSLLFPDWHEYCEISRDYCQTNLVQISKITSSLQDWFYDFQHLKLCEIRSLKQVSKLGYTFSLSEFSRIQTIYRANVVSMLQHVWHRGALMLIKRNQYLRNSEQKTKWTFLGPKPQHKRKPQVAQSSNFIREDVYATVKEDHEGEEDDDNNQQDQQQQVYHTHPHEEPNKDDSYIYEDEEKLCYFSVEQAFANSQITYNPHDASSTLSAFLERLAYLDNPDPQDPSTFVGYCDLQTNTLYPPFKKNEKEQRRKILDNAAILLSLQLRKVVEQSLDFLKKEILSIPDFRTWCYDLNHQVVDVAVDGWGTQVTQSLIQVGQLYKDQDIVFIAPAFLVHQAAFSPFLRIDMVYEGDGLKFRESEDHVKSEFMDLVRNIIASFDKFLHPRFSKIHDEESTNKKPIKSCLFNFEPDVVKEDYETYYKQFWSVVRIHEKQPKEHPELLLVSPSDFDVSPKTKNSQQKKKYLQVASVSEGEFVTLENTVISHIVRHLEECVMSFEVFEQFKAFIDRSADKEIKALIQKKQISNEEFKIYMDILKKYQKLLESVPTKVQFPLFQVNCEPVLKSLTSMLQEFKERIFNRFETSLIDAARAISDKYVQISNYIRRSLKTPDDVEAMEKYIADLTTDRVGLKQRTTDIFQRLIFMIKQNFTSSESLLSLAEELYNRPNQLDKELIEQEEKHVVERQRLEKELRNNRTKFEYRVDGFVDDASNFETFTEYGRYKDYIIQIEEFEQRLQTAEREMLDIVDQEQKLFGYASQFDKFLNLQKEIQPFSDMWKSISIFLDCKKKWLYGAISELDAPEVESIVKTQIKAASKLVKAFKPNSIPFNVAADFQNDVQQMNKHLPAIELLSNPGLRDRHWEQIALVMGIRFNHKEGTLRELLNKGVEGFLVRIEEVSENASKEFSLENSLNKMETEWQTLKLSVINFKNRGVLILQGSSVEDIQILLDEHTIKAQTIRSNPAVKFMESKAIRWEKLMLFIQEVLDVWVKVQTMYLYLEPIFSFEDINKTLFEESEKFQKVSMNWTMIMQRLQSNPLVLELENIPNLLENLLQSLRWIEEIQKGLENHLEIKRLEFPRFFFLSNDDLINILAETRDPLLVQPHMRKCFEGIDELIFSSSAEILGMKSIEREEVLFEQKVQPREFKSYVEKWLQKVEEEMRSTLQHLIIVSSNELHGFTSAHKPRQEWLRRWSSQCILASSCMSFTSQVESIMQSGQSLTTYEQQLQQQLQEVVSIVRTSSSNIERMMLSALIVLEVHNNDILNELIHEQVSSPLNFLWMSQMRYYIPEDSGELQVRMVYTNLKYGYEYLGVGTRLVITPLTDRCYRTLVGALQLNLGGAPEGPAGTGKTESTKDLAKAIAVQCVVFNCGEGLNTFAMAKFFKGLIAAGAWSCFDEFNRIDLEVLSVIAQQILQIQQAKCVGKSRFTFEGTELNILFSCNIFITMNPGYAGRSELPDNLKALFRPCAMMVPDYALIAEISLYSFGFVEARSLAKKIVAVYKLCSEQLSSQDHYDYGMRAVKSVLTAAAQLKRKQALEREDILILRAITDINLPKFLTQDVILFNGIVMDLFPGIKLSPLDYKNLQESLSNVMTKMNLQQVPNFRKKVFQLYEMVNCRHGLMLVGATLSGKSTCYKVLSQTLTYCNKTFGEEKPCQYHTMNPKAVTLQQLYGYSDPVSKEWTEGILAEIYRKCATSQLPDRQFIVFDGPVDADWIENMNTVLDDNKKLCLMNGETIAMSDRMTIIFEVQDLSSASPATVSRCGMVYLQPDQLGWYNIFLSQLSELTYDSQVIERIEGLFEAILDKCISFVKSKCQEYERVPESSFAISALRFLKALLKENSIEEHYRKMEDLLLKVDALFIYAILWTVGGAVDDAGRKIFDSYFKKLLREPIKSDYKKDRLIKIDRQSNIPELSSTQTYDFFYDFSDGRWRNWKDILKEQIIPPQAQFNQIMVETTESMRITSLLSRAIDNSYPFLLIGPSGVGKTRYVRKYFSTLPFNKYLVVFINFQATSSCQRTQQQIDTKLERRRKGVYGPGIGVEGLIFVDDMNLPQTDKYGAQPPLELLRQLQDQGGWYSHERQFMSIVNMTIMACMSPPGGGRAPVTQRLLRNFNLISLAPPDNANMQRIYQTIVEWHLKKVFGPLVNQEIYASYGAAIESVIDLYNQMRDGLKPTPAKSWYFLNMRDISRCVQGMTLAASSQEITADHRKIARLWLHESARTFFDRLHESDYDLFWTMLNNTVRSKLRDDLKSIMKPYEEASSIKMNQSNPQELQKYYFSDVLGEDLTPQDRQYTEVISMRRVFAKVQFYLDELNSNTKKPLNLALFDYAIEHLLKLIRVLRMQQGHALLIGLGGSGRQSLTRLACFIRDQDLYQFEVTKSYNPDKWKEDLQRVMIATAVNGKESCFILADHQMTKSFLLEDVNALLNTGDVPNLFASEEFIPFIDKLRSRARKEGYQELFESGTTLQFYDYFVESGKRKLHIILTMSPIGDAVRNRIRLFPSVVNCTTIDCFQQWPDEALEAVAKKFLSDMNLDASSQRQLIAQCKYMHEQLLSTSTLYKQQEGRYNYVTPGSYFALLQTFQSLLQVERTKLEDMKMLYTTGVQKLDSTAIAVKQMEMELIEKTPLLKKMNEDTILILDEIQAQALAMEPKQQQAVIEEAMVNERVAEAQIIKEDCEKDLSVAKPKLKQAEDALNTLDSNDINSIKSMLKPPETVQLVMEAICVICGIPAISIPNPKNPKERLMSYWEASKKFLSDKDFLQKLIHFDKENIKEDIMKKIRDRYISQTTVFNAKRVEKASSAAKGLCEWILAIDDYEKVQRVVRPKQLRYNQSKQEVERLQASLKLTRGELEALNKQIKELQDKLSLTQQKQAALSSEIMDCEVKLLRASQLMNGLGGERERWELQSVKFEQRLKLILGDMILAAGAVSNLGVFTSSFRIKLTKLWQDKLKQMGGSLQPSDNFSLEVALATPMIVRKWRLNGLPSDTFSTDNGIILNRCQRYPLLVDPQAQGNRFIKQNESAEGSTRLLKVTKQTDSDFLRVVENAVSFGQALLIENIGEDIDSVLDSILQKQTFKQTGIMSVKLGESVVEFNKGFTLYMTSKLRNPHYTPETAMKVTLVNFTITQSGLEDQLLEICVQKEKPDLEDQKNKLIVQSHLNQLELQRVEDRILDVLKQASNILNDEEGINILQQSKTVANEIEERQKVSDFTEKKIDEARVGYKPIAIHSALIFFAVIALSPLDPLYQYSLNWFIGVYQDAFSKADTSPYLKQRIENVNSTVMFMIFNQVCRGLFEKDKILFSFIIQVKIMEQKKHLDGAEFSFLVQPLQLESENAPENPFLDWIPQLTWLRVQQIMKLSKKFSQLPDSFQAVEQVWRQIMIDQNAHSIKLPEPFISATPMQRLCVLKVLRPDKLTRAIQDFIATELGEKYTQPPQFSIQQSFSNSSSSIPLLFILPGSDPMNTLVNFAEMKNIQLRSVSLGQGQGVVAEKEIEDARQNGHWVILQNCHLSPSWMPRLEKICEELQRSKLHPAFRLWLSSYSSTELPTSVVQSAVKMTNEPPNGIKANLLGSYGSVQIQSIPTSPQLSKLLFSLCFFHAIMQERRQFGPIGFNIRYDFNQSDLFISIRQLQQLIQMADGGLVAFKAFHYLVGECNYGGRVTDERDRRILKALLQEYVSEAVLYEEFKFGGLKQFQMPQANTHDDLIKYIEALPNDQPCQLFGFHPNAEIMKDINQTEELLRNVLIVTSGQIGNKQDTENQNNDKSKQVVDPAKQQENILRQLCADLLSKCPKRFDTEIAMAKFPLDYKNSMNTVLLQEILRYNKLINVIQLSLKEVEAALKGLVAMSDNLEKVTKAMLIGQVPEQWKKVSYPSVKPLGSYMADFFRRIQHYQQWMERGTPLIYWISGFFFTQSFLTSILQNYARKYTIAIDKLGFEFEFFEQPAEKDEQVESTHVITDGQMVYGLFLEGCKWDHGKQMLTESDPKVLYTLAPIIWLKPVQTQQETNIDEFKSNQYRCPVYKTTERKGVLSTTGHSTNFIMIINMPSAVQESHWVKRGVALLCQLSD